MATEVVKLSPKIKAYLSKRYYDPNFPGSFSGLDKFFRGIKQDGQYSVKKRDIKEWLEGEDTYTVNRAVRRKFKRNRVIVSGIDNQWDGDLMVLDSLAKYNSNYKYVLLLIDIFSRYIWTVKMKNKNSTSTIAAFKNVFKKGRVPELLRTDRGSEFVSRPVKNYLKDVGIRQFWTQNTEIKANYAERAIKTVKSKLFKYMHANHTYKYIDALDSITEAYNNSYHTSIKMAPSQVNKENESTLWQQLYLPTKSDKAPKIKFETFKYKVGDFVRISFLKKTFTREYDQKWSDEIFRVSKRYRREGLPVYKLKDYTNTEDIEGTFYQPEIQKVRVSPDKFYKIDKILGTKTVRGKRFYKVSWEGWGSQFNSYVSSKDIKGLKKKKSRK